jgi:hypothetical protein
VVVLAEVLAVVQPLPVPMPRRLASLIRPHEPAPSIHLDGGFYFFSRKLRKNRSSARLKAVPKRRKLVDRSIANGRRDVEWWIFFVCAVALALPLIPCEELESRSTLDFLRASAFGAMAYVGFWIAGRSHRKKYINPSVDGVAGGLIGVVGLIGGVIFGFPWLVLFFTYRDKKTGPTPLSETGYEKFLFEWQYLPVAIAYISLFFLAFWTVALYYVGRRNVVDEQQAYKREQWENRRISSSQ